MKSQVFEYVAAHFLYISLMTEWKITMNIKKYCYIEQKGVTVV